MEQVRMQTAPTIGIAKAGPYQGSSVWRGGGSFYAQHKLIIEERPDSGTSLVGPATTASTWIQSLACPLSGELVTVSGDSPLSY
jgi:hypothetical protein